MVNYYDILKVSPKASTGEIKSAYRKLARTLHPDKNNGSGETALKFAAIAEAYEILGNSRERAKYDRQLIDAQYAAPANGDSVFGSANPHAKRWRQMVYERRYNDILDRMIAEEHREAMAFQKAVYPLAALLISCFLSAALRPNIFENSAMIGKMIIVSLFIIGMIRLIGRLRDGFEKFTQPDDDIHDSILDESERKHKPYSRLASAGVLLGAVIVSIGLGLLASTRLDIAAASFPSMFGTRYLAEFLFYPPIITLLADTTHTIVSKIVSGFGA